MCIRARPAAMLSPCCSKRAPPGCSSTPSTARLRRPCRRWRPDTSSPYPPRWSARGRSKNWSSTCRSPACWLKPTAPCSDLNPASATSPPTCRLPSAPSPTSRGFPAAASRKSLPQTRSRLYGPLVCRNAPGTRAIPSSPVAPMPHILFRASSAELTHHRAASGSDRS